MNAPLDPWKPFLRDPALDREFAARGFVAVPDVLTAEEAARLRADFLAMAPRDDRGMCIDFMREDRAFLRDASEMVRAVLEPHLPRLFVDHDLLLASFVTKWPGDDSIMALHEDRTYVDPLRHCAANCWIALDDTGPDIGNGGLQVVPCSNQVTPRWVGTNAADVIRPFAPYLLEHVESPTVRAGAAILYDNWTLHGSPPNTTDEVRVAVACEIVPREAELLHFFATTRRHRTVHRIDADFLLDVHPNDVDEEIIARYPLVDEFEDDTRVLDADILAHYPPGASATPVRTPRPAPSTARLRREPSRLPWLHEDLPATASPIASDGRTAAAWDVRTDKGALALVAVKDSTATTPPAPPPEWAAYLAPFLGTTDAAAVLLADPRSLGQIRFHGDPEDPWRIDVMDVTFGRGHIGIDGHDEVLDESVALAVRGTEVSAWNHGPGVLALLLSAEPTPAPTPTPTPAPEPAPGPTPGGGAASLFGRMARLGRHLRRRG